MTFHRIALVGASLAFATPASADHRKPIDVEPLAAVYFGFDSARLSAIMSFPLAGVAMWAEQHPNAAIVLDGNTDSRGASAYNAAHGLRRARSVEHKLIALGVDPKRVVIVTYGEDGLRHAADGLDRNVAIWASEQPLYSIVERSLVRGTAVVWNQPVPAVALAPPKQPIQVGTR